MGVGWKSLLGDLYSIFILPINSLRFYMKDQPLPLGCGGFSFFAYGLWLCSAWNLLGIAILFFHSTGNGQVRDYLSKVKGRMTGKIVA